MKDFFISFNRADRERAEWIAWTLEEAGHTVVFQSWDFRPGENFVLKMQNAAVDTRCTLAVLSDAYLKAEFTQPEWAAAFVQDPRGEQRRLIPVRVAPCSPPGSFTAMIHVDLVGLAEDEAKAALLRGVSAERAKPAQAPAFHAAAAAGPHIDTTRLPTPGPHFVGRQAELAHLDEAWADPQVNVISIVAFGGVGKSALVFCWLERLRRDNWRGAARVLAWSFYSQGTQERLASADAFIDFALRWCGDPDPTLGSPRDRGIRLAELIRRQRTLLILDGLEPLQHPPTALAGGAKAAGRLKDPGMAALLKTLAQSHDGLCVVTTRERVAELAAHEHDGGAARHIEPESLSPEDGAARLRELEVKGKPEELQAATKECAGHALTLTLLGSYLRDACAGDVRRRAEIPLGQADRREGGGQAFQVMAAYEQWLSNNPLSPARGGEGRGEGESDSATSPTRAAPHPIPLPAARGEGSAGRERNATSETPALAILRLLGLFDRPAAGALVAALRAAPAIAGLTEPLLALSNDEWQMALTTLRRRGLLGARDAHDPDALDAHPLVRAYFAERLEQERPDAWRAGHLRLYEHLCHAAPHLPHTLTAMLPLYQAMIHGCRAGQPDEALSVVYWHRILRGSDQFSALQLGAFGSELTALAAFFEHAWDRPRQQLTAPHRAFVLSQSSLCLRALGRQQEAVQPVRAALMAGKAQADWLNAATRASHLSELQLTLGNVPLAVDHGEEAIEIADRSLDAAARMIARATLAHALHQAGEREASLKRFCEAETLQARYQRDYPQLYSVRGYQYCDLLLGCAELDDGSGHDGPASATVLVRRYLDACVVVHARARVALDGAEAWRIPLDIGLHQLILGRAHVGFALAEVRNAAESFARAGEHFDRAVEYLRKAAAEEFVNYGLIARASFHRLRAARATGNGSDADARAGTDDAARTARDAADADLAEALDIATRGEMRLHLADTHLEWTRLHLDHGEIEAARQHHEQARQLVAETGYHRRDREVTYLTRRLSEKK